MYHAPKGKGFFLPWLTFHLWVGKIGFFVSRPVWQRKNAFPGSGQCFFA